ncbi:uncharacterized protein LOC102679765 [Apis dorsata]|uniref:uncharacterized protein LOC102679765 n=1 Tax=Apis dorsata TaxID=7462 RepID=UPI0003DF6422|nr:uncharacterized protein LOC102679765 [Apis dorsata]XP_006625242.1 uncharacterized protein LOC102679765 [Apis dorsata]
MKTWRIVNTRCSPESESDGEKEESKKSRIPDISVVGMLSIRMVVLDLVPNKIVLQYGRKADCPRKRDSTGRRLARSCAIAFLTTSTSTFSRIASPLFCTSLLFPDILYFVHVLIVERKRATTNC